MTGDSILSKVHARIQASQVVDKPGRYFLREVAAIPSAKLGFLATTDTYRVDGRTVTLKHDSNTSFVFREMFVDRRYAPPPEIASMLATDRPLTILELGGHIGLFGLYASIEWPKCEIRAFEPDPTNAAKYRQLIADNHFDWNLTAACAGNRNGTVHFSAIGSGDSSISQDGIGSLVPIVDVVPLFETADLVKMDIEGGEWEILADERLSSGSNTRTPVVVMEYHPYSCPGDDPRQLAIQLLHAAGYRTRPICHGADGVGMLWAYRPSPDPIQN